MLAACKRALRRRIVLAAPSCTLWRRHPYEDALVFVLWPHWRISGLEQMRESFNRRYR